MKGITPGPMMYVTELPTVYRVFAALMLANLCMLVVGCLGVRFFAKIVSVEKKMLYPIILVISCWVLSPSTRMPLTWASVSPSASSAG